MANEIKVQINEGCQYGGESGYLLMVQEFVDRGVFAWIVVDGRGDVGWWYHEDCYTVVDGSAKSNVITSLLKKGEQTSIKVKKGDYEAVFFVPNASKQLFKKRGYDVTDLTSQEASKHKPPWQRNAS